MSQITVVYKRTEGPENGKVRYYAKRPRDLKHTRPVYALVWTGEDEKEANTILKRGDIIINTRILGIQLHAGIVSDLRKIGSLEWVKVSLDKWD